MLGCIMKIVVIGAGPIGGIVGGRILIEGNDVTLVDGVRVRVAELFL